MKTMGVIVAPYDIDPEDPYICGIRSDELFRVMDDSTNTSKFVVLLDCCYSGNVLKDSKSVIESDIESSKGAEILVNSFKRKGISEADKGKKIILASSKPSEKAFEKEFHHDKLTEDKLGLDKFGQDKQAPHFHGIFSGYLIEALSGQGLPDEGAKPISIANIYSYIMNKMESGIQGICYQYDDPALASTVMASYGKSDEQIKITLRDVAKDIKKIEEDYKKEVEKALSVGSLIPLAKNLYTLMGSDFRGSMNVNQESEYNNHKEKLDNFLNKCSELLANWFLEPKTVNELKLMYDRIFPEPSKCSYFNLMYLSRRLSFDTSVKTTSKEQLVLSLIHDFIRRPNADYEFFKKNLEVLGIMKE